MAAQSSVPAISRASSLCSCSQAAVQSSESGLGLGLGLPGYLGLGSGLGLEGDILLQPGRMPVRLLPFRLEHRP